MRPTKKESDPAKDWEKLAYRCAKNYSKCLEKCLPEPKSTLGEMEEGDEAGLEEGRCEMECAAAHTRCLMGAMETAYVQAAGKSPRYQTRLMAAIEKSLTRLPIILQKERRAARKVIQAKSKRKVR